MVSVSLAFGVALLARLASCSPVAAGIFGSHESVQLSREPLARSVNVVSPATTHKDASSVFDSRDTAPASTLSPKQSIVSAGHTRTFFYYKPNNFNPALGMIMYLHGGGSNGSQAAYGGTDNLYLLLADRVGVLLLWPDGKPYNTDPTKATWNDCLDSTKGNCSACTDWNDVQFIRDLIPWVTTNINGAVDTTRVYVAGESEGGNMVERLALEANDVIAAAANAAGNLAVSNDNSPTGAYKCSGYTEPWTPGTNQAVPMFLFKGTLDPRIPYGSTTGPDSNNYCQIKDKRTTPPCPSGAVHSYYDTVAFWEWKLGISSSPTVQVADTTTVNYPDTVPDCTDTSNFAGCDGSTVTRHNLGPAPYRLVFEEAVGGGHAFPGVDPETANGYAKSGWKNRDALGQPNPYIAEEMWAFFSQWTLAD